MSKRAIGHTPKMIQNLFVVLLLALFALLSTFLVTMGAQLYRNTVDSFERNNNTRIMTSVVRSAIWAEDGGDVYIEKFDDLGITALTVREADEDGYFYTRLYAYDGYLRECFTPGDIPFDPEYGETMCELNRFEPEMDGKMLTVALESEDGVESTIRMYLRAGGADI